MRDEELIETTRETLRRWSQEGSDELWEGLVRRGIIDEAGNVLVSMPEPPIRLRTNKKKQKNKDSSATRKRNGKGLPEDDNKG